MADLLEGFCQLVGEGAEFVVGELHMMVEVHVALVLHGDEVDVGVRHFEAEHGYADLAAGAYLLDGMGHAVGEGEEFVVERIVEVEDVVDFLFWDAEDVTTHHRVDVEECKAVVGFGNFVAGNFTGYDF